MKYLWNFISWMLAYFIMKWAFCWAFISWMLAYFIIKWAFCWALDLDAWKAGILSICILFSVSMYVKISMALELSKKDG